MIVFFFLLVFVQQYENVMIFGVFVDNMNDRMINASTWKTNPSVDGAK